VPRRLAAGRNVVVKAKVSPQLATRLARSGRKATIQLNVSAVSDGGGRLERGAITVRIRR
jgi:hypothetical protein